ncbi:MAG: hypothetical protein Q4Q17_04110 [Tissierellia bacterium]|nr:hypothetical protein [Tissierellia bacterium]
MGDFFTVSVGEVGKEMVLTLEYEGRVYYMSRIHCIDIFTTRWASALPPRFAFLPLMDGDMTKKQFDLSVLSHNTVVSNLQVEGGEKNQYHLTGESISVALFSGYFVEERSNGHTIIRMKYNGLTDYEAIYERGFQHGVYNGLTNEREEGEDFPCSKVFMMHVDYETYGYPLRMDEYLLMDYGGFYGE